MGSTLGSYDTNIYAINSDGSLKWFFKTGDIVHSSPAIGADDTVYIGSRDGMIYALNPDDGCLKWSYKTGGNVDSSPAIGSEGTIYIGSDDGRLYAIGENEIFYLDNDDDKYGDPNLFIIASSCPEGYVSNDDDCDDNHKSVYPGASEIYDGKDNDCDGKIDEECIVSHSKIKTTLENNQWNFMQPWFSDYNILFSYPLVRGPSLFFEQKTNNSLLSRQQLLTWENIFTDFFYPYFDTSSWIFYYSAFLYPPLQIIYSQPMHSPYLFR